MAVREPSAALIAVFVRQDSLSHVEETLDDVTESLHAQCSQDDNHCSPIVSSPAVLRLPRKGVEGARRRTVGPCWAQVCSKWKWCVIALPARIWRRWCLARETANLQICISVLFVRQTNCISIVWVIRAKFNATSLATRLRLSERARRNLNGNVFPIRCYVAS